MDWGYQNNATTMTAGNEGPISGVREPYSSEEADEASAADQGIRPTKSGATVLKNIPGYLVFACSLK
jgi:hypothetical protein